MEGGRLDIRALLAVALEETPPDDLADRVMARVAAVATLGEVVRLFTEAPLEGLQHAFAQDASAPPAGGAADDASDAAPPSDEEGSS